MNDPRRISENALKNLRKSFRQLLEKQPFTTANLQKNFKQIVIAGVIFCLLSGSAAAFYIKTNYKEFAEYQLELHSPSEQNGVFLMGEKGEITVQVQESTPARFSLTNLKGLRLTLNAGSEILQEEALDVFPKPNSEVSKILQFDPSKLGDGEHELTVYLSDASNSERIFASKTVKVIRDNTDPILNEVTTNRGTLSRYALDNSAKASAGATVVQNGIKLVSNSSEPFTLSLSFSEAVRAVADENQTASTAGALVFAETPAATLAAVFTPGAKNIQLPAVFQDLAGNAVTTEIQFVLDVIAPKLNLSSQYSVLESNRGNFSFTFSASEPLSFVKATANGVTKNATGSYKSYQVTGLPMSQDTNTVKLTGQDLAGNSTSAEVTVNVTKPAPISMPTASSRNCYFNPANGKCWYAPSDARHCDDKDKAECGYVNVSDMTCEEFKVVKDCLKTRCPYDGYSLGSCEY